MALRAGYYGVKRGLKDKLAQIARAWDATVESIFTKTYQSLVGAANLFDYSYNTVTNYGTTKTFNADHTLTITGGPSDGARALVLGNFQCKANTHYYLTGCPAGGGKESGDFWLGAYIGGEVRTDMMDGGTGADFTLEADTQVSIRIRIPNGFKPGEAGVVFKPMISLYPGAAYAMPSKTNIELTNEIALDEATIGDHKITINGIISAATGAADFAAFKTAMEALTPLTRSAVPETRSVEEIVEAPEEPVVEKKTTTRKKSTAKADTTKEV